MDWNGWFLLEEGGIVGGLEGVCQHAVMGVALEGRGWVGNFDQTLADSSSQLPLPNPPCSACPLLVSSDGRDACD